MDHIYCKVYYAIYSLLYSCSTQEMEDEDNNGCKKRKQYRMSLELGVWFKHSFERIRHCGARRSLRDKLDQ
jgi:hypothetical protein